MPSSVVAHAARAALLVTVLAAGAAAVSVTVGLSVSDVHYDMKISSDERRQVTDTATVAGWLSAEWVDATLAWSGAGATSRHLRSDEEVWLPDIRHLNPTYASSSNLLTRPGSAAVVDQSGKVHYECPVSFSVRFIPRDFEQRFEIRLGSRVMTRSEMTLEPASETLDMSEYTGWYVHNTWMWKNETTRAGFTEPFSLLVAGVYPTII